MYIVYTENSTLCWKWSFLLSAFWSSALTLHGLKDITPTQLWKIITTEQSGGKKVQASLKCGQVCLFPSKGVHASNYYLHQLNTYTSSYFRSVLIIYSIEGTTCIWTPGSMAALPCQHYLKSLLATYFGCKEYWLIFYAYCGPRIFIIYQDFLFFEDPFRKKSSTLQCHRIFYWSCLTFAFTRLIYQITSLLLPQLIQPQQPKTA